ncbi:MAG: hypothetical protein LKG24_05970 [Lacticaseibacillus songhuajiangensis]|jgi:hypothetical protein|nr:hypothetical protein [Lacticaseibacillus songhuajiangensis]
MKEFVYLDTRFMNSLLAQLDDGLSIGSHLSTSNAESEEQGTTQSAGANAQGGGSLAGIIKASTALTTQNGINTNNVQSKSASEIIDSIMDDSAFNLLENKLQKRTHTNLDNVKEGDFVQLTGKFRFYDFGYLSKITQKDTLNLFLKMDKKDDLEQINQRIEAAKKVTGSQRVATLQQLRSKRKQIMSDDLPDVFDKMSRALQFMNDFMPDTVLIAVGDGLAFCSKKSFRETSAQLSMLSGTSRTIKITGLVETLLTTTDAERNGDFPELQSSEMYKLAEMLGKISFGNIGIYQDKNYLIRPVAISFDC